jgi:hypothetical protein
MITQKTYTMISGGSADIFDPLLAGGGVTVLSVKRENNRYYSSGGAAPSPTEYLHTNLGFLSFLNAVPGTGMADVDNERVTVIFKS